MVNITRLFLFTLTLSFLVAIFVPQTLGNEDIDDFESVFEQDESDLDMDIEDAAIQPDEQQEVIEKPAKDESKQSNTGDHKEPTKQHDDFMIDDFEINEEVGEEKVEKKENTRAPAPTITTQQFLPLKRDFTMEICFGVFIVIYGIIFLIGRMKNQSIADKWYKEYKPYIARQFYAISVLVKKSQSEFAVTASGRVYCKGIHCNLDLVRRQDLVNVASAFIFGTKDTVTIDIPLVAMEPFVFAVVRSTEAIAFQKAHTDVSTFAKVIKTQKLPNAFSVIADSEGVINGLLQPQVVATLKKYEKYVKQIYVTDSNQIINHSMNMRFIFVIPSDPTEMKTLIDMMFYLIDRVAEFKLSKMQLQVAKKKRQKATAEKWKQQLEQRQEAAQQRKFDKVLEQKSKMTPAEFEKFKLKQQKKQLKKRAGKMKVRQV